MENRILLDEKRVNYKIRRSSGSKWVFEIGGGAGRFFPVIRVISCLVMKTASKVAIILLVAGVGLVAAQEKPRQYVENCICSICSYFFGED